ncbi:hypothetical protein [Pseudoalteromonas luteoviolacea]|uniref:hypothetical protein n=1 Tax=Pseudoalteromonas luteoviolacea TaxID=43657 RepID=UPI001B365CC4|nr:hypothetical protein [Pseudoalteromonas luteoviolacea]MBQ4839590.1 hypothetical protein [Pseudoalteromonas luteoviolacea]
METKCSQPFRVVLLCMFFSALSTVVNATERVSGYIYNQSSTFSVHHEPSASTDFLVVESSAAVTTLNFNKFATIGKPVLIKIPSDSNIETLVVNASSIDIQNSVSVMGKPVDLVFISNGGSVSCNNCSFDNAGRVSFVNGTFSGGIVRTRVGGKVTISNLSAPGLQSLEVMSDSIVTSGVIDLNLRAERHPNSGFIQSSRGTYVLGSGGINLYPGRFTIRYSNLDMISSTTLSSNYQPVGTFKAASIGIVTSQPVTIPTSTVLNTMSDALATSTRQGQFYAPAEGVFIQIAEHESAALNVYGKLYSDRIITTKTIGATTYRSGSRLIGQTVKSFSDRGMLNQGYIDAGSIEVAASRLINSGTLNGSKVNIEVEGDVYNTFGGVIKAGTLSVDLNDGIFTNGSRTNRLNWPTNKSLQAPSINVNSLKHGPYSGYSTAGTAQSRLSAKIHANTIKIVAKAIENINPYHIEEPSGVDWSAGIRVNTAQSEQVSIAAESKIELKASQYIRNSSAILRLNQQGLFHIDTPLLFNERYRLETTSYIISRYAYTSENKGSRDTVEQGIGTKIAAYSPPGRIVSFGEFQIGSKSVPSNRRRFVNAFSYIELFGNARFQKLDLESIGIKLSSTVATDNFYAIKQCMAIGNCSGTSVDTSVEGETLLAIHGNVYGINPNVESQSDLTVTDSNSLNATTNAKIREYFQRYVKVVDEDTYEGYSSPKVQDQWVTAYLYKCDGYRYEEHGLVKTENCSYSSVRVALSTILGETSSADFENTGYTFKEVTDAAKSYASRRRYVSRAEDYRCDNQRYSCTAQNFKYQNVVVSDGGKKVTVSYKYEISIDDELDDFDTPFIRYISKSPTITVAELMAGK